MYPIQDITTLTKQVVALRNANRLLQRKQDVLDAAMLRQAQTLEAMSREKEERDERIETLCIQWEDRVLALQIDRIENLLTSPVFGREEADPLATHLEEERRVQVSLREAMETETKQMQTLKEHVDHLALAKREDLPELKVEALSLDELLALAKEQVAQKEQRNEQIQLLQTLLESLEQKISEREMSDLPETLEEAVECAPKKKGFLARLFGR